MKSFTDTKGRCWAVEMNVSTAKRIKSLTGVDVLTAVQQASWFADLSADTIKLVDVIYAAVKPQADGIGVSDEDFGSAMSGDVITDAANALVDEIIAFFPQAARRQLVTKARAKLKEVEARAMVLAMGRLESGEIDKAIDAALAASGRPFTNSLASSA